MGDAIRTLLIVALANAINCGSFWVHNILWCSVHCDVLNQQAAVLEVDFVISTTNPIKFISRCDSMGLWFWFTFCCHIKLCPQHIINYCSKTILKNYIYSKGTMLEDFRFFREALLNCTSGCMWIHKKTKTQEHHWSMNISKWTFHDMFIYYNEI